MTQRRGDLHGEAGYERTRSLLADHGFIQDDVLPYTGETFGSWAITISHIPRLRIVWDAKDGWAIVQGELRGVPRQRGESPWEDLWVGKRPEDVTPDAVVQALERLRDFAGESRGRPD